MIHGKDLILTAYPNSSISYLFPLAAAKSCEIGVDTDFIEVANPADGSWREYRPTIHGWSASASCLVAHMSDVDKLFDFQKNKYLLTLTFYDKDLKTYYKGTAYIKSLKVTGSVGGLATMSVGFQTTGELQQIVAIDFDMYHAQDSQAGYGIDWLSSSEIATDHSQGSELVYVEMNFTARTGFSASNGIAVIKRTWAQVAEIMQREDDQALMSYTVLLAAYGKYNQTILASGKYTVIANREDAERGHCEFTYLTAQ